jgi:hypothetical protein
MEASCGIFIWIELEPLPWIQIQYATRVHNNILY